MCYVGSRHTNVSVRACLLITLSGVSFSGVKADSLLKDGSLSSVKKL